LSSSTGHATSPSIDTTRADATGSYVGYTIGPVCPHTSASSNSVRSSGLGFNIWFQPVAGAYKDILAKTQFDESWSVPSQASEGDLVLYYRTGPDGFVQDIFRVAGPVRHVTAGWKPGKDYMAAIRRVCTLKAPLHLSEMKDHPVVRSAGFVRGNMRGRYKASDYWPDLYRMIVARNPSVKTLLAKYGPDRI
jgi:hypothetical protein